MLDRVQAGGSREHPAGKDALDLPCSVTSSTSTKASVFGVRSEAASSIRAASLAARRTAPSRYRNVKRNDASVILSRPENIAVGLTMRCGDGETTTSSVGCGVVLAGWGALRGEPGPGGKAGAGWPGATPAPCGA